MRYLIVRLAALGDIAVATSLLSRIRQEDPDAQVDWVCGRRAMPLVSLFEGVGDVMAVDEARLLRGSLVSRVIGVLEVWNQTLRRKRYDRVFLLHADPRYRLLTLPFWRRTRALRHGPGKRANPIPARFRGDECARLFDGEASVGPLTRSYPLADVRPRLKRRTTPHRAEQPSVVLVPGGARNVMREDALRRWPVASYRLLAEALLRQGFAITLIGDASDSSVAEHFEGLEVRNCIGRTTLPETLELLQEVDVVVSHDTGPLHLARLVRTPAVGLFGPTNPREMVGDTDDVVVLWGGRHLACRPCYDGRNYAACSDNVCLGAVTVHDVVDAVSSVIARSRTMRSRNVPGAAMPHSAERYDPR